MTTTFKQERSAEPSPASQCFDPLESFINYDQTVLPTPSVSPLSSRSKSTSSTPHTSTLLPDPQPAQPIFSGPSHQYDQYRQQAGLPVGALQNTFAINQLDQFGSGRTQQSYMMPPIDDYYGINTNEDFLDFGSAPSQMAMDLDFGSPTDLNPQNDDFVNPTAVGGQESASNGQQAQIHPGRVWPGMHQQAALAKAQAEAQQQKQQVAARQESKPSISNSRQGRNGSNPRPPTDPQVEASISRLLNQMRHNSVTSSNDDDGATPNASGSQGLGNRTRKDEEDMDEDERLLASEEGKKLSSKERRQLRNKVSARAFRSRRKEYIGQLEGEIATKTAEADNLRIKNEELKTENTRLTDLTRMLLSSPAFSTFLNDLSSTGIPASLPQVSQSQPQASASRTQAAPRKDVNPNQVASGSGQGQSQQQGNLYVGMTMIPEEGSFETLNQGFTDNMDYGGLYDAQVYAVTSVPEGPPDKSLDFAMLHSKSSNVVGPYHEVYDIKDEPAIIETMPTILEKVDRPAIIDVSTGDDDFDLSDPAFALYNEETSAPQLSEPTVAPEDRIFGEIELEKAFGRVELIIEDDSPESREISSATMERFQRLCLRLDAASARISAITSHR